MSKIKRMMTSLLDARGMNQNELAQKVGLSGAAISKIINGQTVPRTRTIQKIADKLCKTDEERRELQEVFFAVAKTDPAAEETRGGGKGTFTFGERRAAAAGLREDVEAFLRQNNYQYRKEKSVFEPDFVVEDRTHIGVECVVLPPSGAVDRIVGQINTAKQSQAIHRLIVCVPYVTQAVTRLRDLLLPHGVPVVTFEQLGQALGELTENAQVPILLPLSLLNQVRGMVRGAGFFEGDVFPESVRTLPEWVSDSVTDRE